MTIQGQDVRPPHSGHKTSQEQNQVMAHPEALNSFKTMTSFHVNPVDLKALVCVRQARRLSLKIDAQVAQVSPRRTKIRCEGKSGSTRG